MADTERKVAKYRFLADTIKEKIENGSYEAGSRMESENELSETFGYSRQTVRQALALLEQEGMIHRRRGSGTYISADKQKIRSGKNVVIITTYISDYIFPSIIRGIEEVLTAQGYSLSLRVTNNRVEDECRILQNLLQDKVDGIIVEGTKTAFPNPNVEQYRSLMQKNIPVIFFNGYYRDLAGEVHVVTDDRTAGIQAAQHLLQRGCRNLGGIFKSDDMQGPSRYAGFSEEVLRCGGGISDESVVWYTTAERSWLFHPDSRAYLFERLRNCDGIVCYNDQIAYRVIELLQENRVRVPADVLVMGFDNSNLSDYSSVKITSFSHPKDEMGRLVAQKMIHMLQTGKAEPSEVLPMPLKVKQSTTR